MNITVSKVKKLLAEEYGWSNMNIKENNFLIDELIKDTLKIVNKELKFHKGISIKKK